MSTYGWEMIETSHPWRLTSVLINSQHGMTQGLFMFAMACNATATSGSG